MNKYILAAIPIALLGGFFYLSGKKTTVQTKSPEPQYLTVVVDPNGAPFKVVKDPSFTYENTVYGVDIYQGDVWVGTLKDGII